tara:strand:+ start:951 stop:1121 length:171 start_codon:yes stop_codon:yes gene_type:complete
MTTLLREYINEILDADKEDELAVTTAIKKIQPNLEKMTKAELELLKLQVQRLIGEL